MGLLFLQGKQALTECNGKVSPLSILFTPFQVSQIPASAPQSRALEVYKETVLPEMPQRVRAHRAARRVRDGVTVRPFRLPEPSLHLPTHCSPLPHAYLLFPFRRCLQTSLCVGGNSGSTANSKQHNFRGERRQAPPPAPGPGTVCRSASQAGGSRPLRRSLHSAVGLMRASVQPLPPSAHAAFSPRLGREARWFSS